MLFQLFSSDLEDIQTARDYWTSPTQHFKISRCNTFEISQHALFLPGNDDYAVTLPRVMYFKFPNNADLLKWIADYTDGYVNINKSMPMILDLNEIGMPEFEDVPDGKLA